MLYVFKGLKDKLLIRIWDYKKVLMNKWVFYDFIRGWVVVCFWLLIFEILIGKLSIFGGYIF